MRTMYKNTDVDIEIEFDDVMEYITDYASDSEIASIRKEIAEIEAEVSAFLNEVEAMVNKIESLKP